jgi:hypothetical protein
LIADPLKLTCELLDLIFATRIEGQGAALRITLTPSQWKNLKFLADGPEMQGLLT